GCYAPSQVAAQLPVYAPAYVATRSSVTSAQAQAALRKANFDDRNAALCLPTALTALPNCPVAFAKYSPQPLIQTVRQANPESTLPARRPSPLASGRCFPAGARYPAMPDASKRLRFPGAATSLLRPVRARQPVKNGAPDGEYLPDARAAAADERG